MRVFVVGTGRCGTCTFYQAATYLEGMTAGHETAEGYVGLLDYPDNHVEVDAQLVYKIPALLDRYPDARWVHLLREPEACIHSLATQSYEAMQAFAFQWLQTRDHLAIPAAARAYYDWTNKLVRTLLPLRYTVNIEQLADQWPRFCERIATDCDPAVAEVFGRAYNPGTARGRDSWVNA